MALEGYVYLKPDWWGHRPVNWVDAGDWCSSLCTYCFPAAIRRKPTDQTIACFVFLLLQLLFSYYCAFPEEFRKRRVFSVPCRATVSRSGTPSSCFLKTCFLWKTSASGCPAPVFRSLGFFNWLGTYLQYCWEVLVWINKNVSKTTYINVSLKKKRAKGSRNINSYSLRNPQCIACWKLNAHRRQIVK